MIIVQNVLLAFFRYHGTFHAFQVLAKQRGVLGLWRGWLPNVQRAALVNLGGSYVLICIV